MVRYLCTAYIKTLLNTGSIRQFTFTWEVWNMINVCLMKQILIYSCISYFFLWFGEAAAQISKSEQRALLDLYNATNGAEWTHTWNLEASANEWYGITIEENHVVSINLHHNNLQGIIPSSIADLKYVKELNLAFNKLTGELPLEVVKLTQLKVLRLEMNRLKGMLPKNIGRLVDLEEMIVFNNMFEGIIPESIGDIKTLKTLNLSSNFLNGGFPKSLENLSNLETLELFGNKLSGAIEADLSKLTKLNQLVLAYNNFDGNVPAGLEDLTQLKFVQIQGNQFDSFSGIENMKSEKLVTFDSDNTILNVKYKIENKRGDDSRMVDTKFETDH